MSIGTILLLFLFVGISLYSRFNKAIAEQNAQANGSEGDEQEVNECLLEEESTETSYFTYETEIVETPNPLMPVERPVHVEAESIEPLLRTQFDLRQAVIAQVILSNKYINEINQ